MLTEAAMKTVRDAAANMQKAFKDASFAYNPAKQASDIDKVTASENKATSATKEHTKAVKALSDAQQRLRDIASGKLSPISPGATVRDVSVGAGGSVSNSVTHPTIKSAGLPNQAFPNLPFGGYSGPKAATPGINFQAIAPLLAAAIGTGVGGPLGGAISGVLTKMNPAVAGVTAAMTALRYAAQQVNAAFERAASLYAKTLSSGGLGQNFVTRQSILASVIGVSEQQIMQYGNQIAVLNSQLALAIRTIAQTQPVLTATAWNFNVLKENLAAVWARVAAAVAPALNRLYELISAFVKLVNVSGLATAVGVAFNALITACTLLAGVGVLAASAVMLLGTALKDLIKNILTFGHSGWADTKEGFKDFKEVLKTMFSGNGFNQGAPTVGSNTARMPASSWERMGMVIGQTGGGTNWNQKTAQGVATLVSINQKIFNALSGHDTFGSFNNPNAAQP